MKCKRKNKSGLVSVIVPVYNRAEQIRYCLDSLLSADYKTLDIIIIDDGSTDKTGEICKQYVAADSRVRYVYQQNKGVSAARNHGLSIAKGEWITFADSDDAVLSHHFNLVRDYGTDELYDLMTTGSSRANVDEFQERFKYVHTKDVIKREDATEYLFGDYDPYRNGICFIWNKIFRHEIIVEYNIRFNETMSMDEDQEFVCRFLQFANGVVYDPTPSYLTLYWPNIHHLGVYFRTPENYLHNIEHCYAAIVDLYRVTNNDNVKRFAATFGVGRTITRILVPYSKAENRDKLDKGELCDFAANEITLFFKDIDISVGLLVPRWYSLLFKLLKMNCPHLAIWCCNCVHILQKMKRMLAK